MKKLLFICAFILLSASIYYDVTDGTLASPSSGDSDPSNTSTIIDEQAGREVTVEPGQTVLSIVERLHDQPVHVSIEKISNDFKEMNNGVEPTDIEVDKSYYFPVYSP
ncbi:hypothetical protein [Salibacterium aidingense]|uniref:hypothetical protein n=1 Tax=Salibacterium aidingense TaxID=384933 RepID=UPI003BBF3990